MATPNPTTRRFPDWYRRNIEMTALSDERLAAMAAEAKECDEHNRAAFAVLQAAFKAYEDAARAFGMELRSIKRDGRTHVPKPVAPYDTCARAVEDLTRRYADHKRAQAKAREMREAEAERAKRERLADIELAKLLVRYNAPAETDWSELLNLICSRDKYLPLAVAGYETRCDWSDGFYRVGAALKRFTIESDRDKDIAADLTGCLRSEDGDGRIFRDTHWNYDTLFALVADQQLVTDAKLCLSEMARG